MEIATYSLRLPSAPMLSAKRDLHLASREAGSQFESMLLAQVFSQLRETYCFSSDLSDDSGSSTFTELGEQVLCEALSRNGGIGIGATISRALEKGNH